MYRTGRNGIRYKRIEVEEWQEEVSGIIREAWGEKPPYEENDGRKTRMFKSLIQFQESSLLFVKEVRIIII